MKHSNILPMIPGFLIVVATLAGSRAVNGASECGGMLQAGQSGGRWGTGSHTVITWSFVGDFDNDGVIDTQFVTKSGEVITGVNVVYTENEAGSPDPEIFPVVGGVDNFPADASSKIEEAFARWPIYADVQFKRVADGATVDIRVGAESLGVNGPLAHAFEPGFSAINGNVHLNRNRSDWGNGLFFSAVLHEIGHALGLNHIVADGTPNVLMYTFIPISNPQHPSFKDIPYIQSIYGPPLPMISQIDAGATLQLQWTYPVDPRPEAGGNPTAAYFAEFGTKNSSNELPVTADPVNDRHEVAGFGFQQAVLETGLRTDGGEDSEVRLFDDTVKDITDVDNWVRNDVRVNSGSRSYHIDAGEVILNGNNEFLLPMLRILADGSQFFEVTNDTELVFSRASTLGPFEELEVKISVDNGCTFRSILNESGSDSPPNRNFEVLAFNVVGEEPNALGKPLHVEFVYRILPTHDGATFFSGLSVDDIRLRNVVTENASAYSDIDDIGAATSLSAMLDVLKLGSHGIRMRALYADCDPGKYSDTQKVVVDSVVANRVTGDHSDSDGLLRAGQTVTITVHFSDVVVLNPANAAPVLELETGAVNRAAEYVSGAGTSDLTFEYTVQDGDRVEGSLDYAVNAIVLGSATIRDANDNIVSAALPVAGSARSLSTSGITIDTTPPRVWVDALRTFDSSPRLSGKLSEPASSVRISVGGFTDVAATVDTCDSGGLCWVLEDDMLGTLSGGAHDIIVRVVDIAGNEALDTSKNELLVITTPPAVINSFVSADNAYIDVRFDQVVYGDDALTSPVEPGDFSSSVSGGNATITVGNATAVDGGSLAGGERVIRFPLMVDGDPPNGEEIVTLTTTAEIYGESRSARSVGDLGSFRLNVDFGVTIKFTPVMAMPMAPTEEVTFGIASTATSGNSDTEDAATDNPLLNLVNAGEKLSRDFRSAASQVRWELSFDPMNGFAPGLLSWTVQDTNPGYRLLIQKLDRGVPSGPPIDMGGMGMGPTFMVDVTARYEILYGVFGVAEMPYMHVGWNLVSTPLMHLQPAADIFNGILAVPVLWHWSGNAFRSLPEHAILNPKRGYWINSTGGFPNNIKGFIQDGRFSLDREWRLIGGTGDASQIPGGVRSAHGWNAADQEMAILSENAPVGKFDGFWVYSESDGNMVDFGN